ncbi:hypothetical protein GLW03_12905 [Halobacillus halophilus]|uniref:hypothetical protein n=1 Tax=Halobacillus halophilus TaxID=1570 RepID=UPI00137136A9|nr:hypothetical protein [Halobacillus halophilus]MYL30725.1 hypothetical protein [Halobacillus halophilus]
MKKVEIDLCYFLGTEETWKFRGNEVFEFEADDLKTDLEYQEEFDKVLKDEIEVPEGWVYRGSYVHSFKVDGVDQELTPPPLLKEVRQVIPHELKK